MSAEYPAGTVAVATVRGVPNVRVMRLARRDELPWMEMTERYAWHEDEYVTDVRPLVVLDPADAAFASTPASLLRYAARLIRKDGIENHGGKPGGRDQDAESLEAWADQIEAQTRPPKPPEPIGLGAVVQARDGRRWVHCPTGTALDAWASLSRRAPWDDIDVVEVLTPGVTP